MKILTLTVVSAKVSAGPHVDFPVLVDVTHNDLRTVSNGGFVTNANGFDIEPTSDSLGTTKLKFQRESYDAVTGRIRMHVKVPSLTTATSIYLRFADPSVISDTQDANGTWNSAFIARHGFGNGASIATADSTAVGNNIASVGSFVANSGGQIYGAAAQGGFSYMTMSGSPLDGLNAFTVDIWIYNPGTGNDVAFFSDWSSQQTLWRYASSNDFRLIINWSDASSTDIAYTATGHATNTWTKMSVTYDGSTVRTYTNGSAGATAAASGKTVKNHTSSNVQKIGGGATGTEDYWRGRVDEMRISNVARAAGWIATEYNAALPSTFWTVGTVTDLTPEPGTLSGQIVFIGLGYDDEL